MQTIRRNVTTLFLLFLSMSPLFIACGDEGVLDPIDSIPNFFDDFESETPGQIPSQWLNGPWPDSGTNFVTDTVSYFWGKSIHVQSDSNGQKGIYAPNTVFKKSITLTTHFLLPSGGVTRQSFGGLDYTGVAVFFEYAGNDSAFIRTWSSDGRVIWSRLFSTEEWHLLRVDFYYNSGRYEVFVDGVSFGAFTYVPNTSNGFGKDLSLRGDNNGGPRTVYFDDISLTDLCT